MLEMIVGKNEDNSTPPYSTVIGPVDKRNIKIVKMIKIIMKCFFLKYFILFTKKGMFRVCGVQAAKSSPVRNFIHSSKTPLTIFREFNA